MVCRCVLLNIQTNKQIKIKIKTQIKNGQPNTLFYLFLLLSIKNNENTQFNVKRLKNIYDIISKINIFFLIYIIK